jgi:transposase
MNELRKSLEQIEQKNLELKAAKGDRDYNATERDLLEILKKHKTKSYFKYCLVPFITETNVQSLQIVLETIDNKIELDQLKDGLLVYVTDHTELKENGDFAVSASDIVFHYKGKYIVENAFREIKSFLDLRPIFVWTEAHVRAHYDICIMAYFINVYISSHFKDQYFSLRNFHEHLDKFGKVIQVKDPSDHMIYKLLEINEKTKQYLNSLGLSALVSPRLQISHGVTH